MFFDTIFCCLYLYYTQYIVELVDFFEKLFEKRAKTIVFPEKMAFFAMYP